MGIVLGALEAIYEGNLGDASAAMDAVAVALAAGAQHLREPDDPEADLGKLAEGLSSILAAGANGDAAEPDEAGPSVAPEIDQPQAVGGLLHVMMPEGRMSQEKAAANPFMFVDTGVPAFFRELYDAGGVKGRMAVKVAGGANVHNVGSDRFKIGKRNYIILKKLFWKNNILINAEDVGGTEARTMYLEIGTGRTWLSTAGREKEL